MRPRLPRGYAVRRTRLTEKVSTFAKHNTPARFIHIAKIHCQRDSCPSQHRPGFVQIVAWIRCLRDIGIAANGNVSRFTAVPFKKPQNINLLRFLSRTGQWHTLRLVVADQLGRCNKHPICESQHHNVYLSTYGHLCGNWRRSTQEERKHAGRCP